MYGGFNLFSSIENGIVVYAVMSFPFFGFIYFSTLFGLSTAIERDSPDIYKKHAPLNPLNKTRMAIGPDSLFSSKLLKECSKFKEKIIFTKWSLIYTLASFFLIVTIGIVVTI